MNQTETAGADSTIPTLGVVGSGIQYGWIIDEDNVTTDEEHRRFDESRGADGLDSRVGRMGPRDIPRHLVKRLRAGEGIPFRLHNDEPGSEPDFAGRFLTDDASTADMLANEVALEAPLVEWGRADAGCTTILHLVGDEWTQLVG